MYRDMYFITMKPNLPIPRKMLKRGICVCTPIEFLRQMCSREKCKSCRLVILMASKKSQYIAKILQMLPIRGRKVFYYWDCVQSGYAPKPDTLSSLKWELWSFDPEDCQKYGMQPKPQFYFIEDAQDNKANHSRAVFYVGNDRGRYAKLDKIRNEIEMAGFVADFHIVADESSIDVDNRRYAERLEYDEVLEHIKEAKAIVEVTMEGQTGLSIRVVECLFCNKKLITNNRHIVNEKFYNPQNIYVMDSGVDISEFLESDYQRLPEEIVNHYEFSAWIHRFLKLNEG